MTVDQASDNGGAWGFARKDAARIATAVRRVEAEYFSSPPARPRNPLPGTKGLVPLSITSNVTAGSEAAPSPFSATVLVPSGSSDGFTATGGQAVTGYNRMAGVVFSASAGTPVSAWGVSLQGVIYLVTADCAPPAPPASCSWLVVTLQDACITTNQLIGTTVSFTFAGSAAGSDVVDGKVTSTGLSNGGGGYSPSTPPAVTFSGGGGSGAAGVAHTNGAGQITSVTITNPGSGYTTPPTVTVAGPGTGAVVNAVLTFGAKLNINAAGTYSWTVSPTNYWPATGSQSLGFSATSCVVNITAAATQLHPKVGNICVQIQGCGLSNLPGASVTFNGTTISSSASATSDANGIACAVVGHSAPPNASGDTYNVTATADRFLPSTVAFAYGPCSNDTGGTVRGQIPLSADPSGYTCLYPATSCPIPVKRTLNISIPSAGSTTLTYSSSIPGDGNSGWFGSLTYNYPDCPATPTSAECPAGSATLNITLYGGSDYSNAPTGILLLRVIPAAGAPPCFAANYFIAGQMTVASCPPSLTLTLAAPLYCTGGTETIRVTEP